MVSFIIPYYNERKTIIMVEYNDIYLRHGIEYSVEDKSKTSFNDNDMISVIHHPFNKDIECRFKTRAKNMVKSDLKCPYCDPYSKFNLNKKLNSVVNSMNKKRKKEGKDNKLFFIKEREEDGVLDVYLARSPNTKITLRNSVAVKFFPSLYFNYGECKKPVSKFKSKYKDEIGHFEIIVISPESYIKSSFKFLKQILERIGRDNE